MRSYRINQDEKNKNKERIHSGRKGYPGLSGNMIYTKKHPVIKMIPIADRPNQGGISLWPSLETASSIYKWSNIALIAALVIGAASTGLVVWMGNVKEAYLKYDLEATKERAAKAELRTAELWKQVQPRELTLDQQKAIGNALRSFHGQKVTVSSFGWDQEGYGLSKQIVSALRSAGLEVMDRSGKGNGPGVEVRGVIVSWWLTEDLAHAIGDAFISIGKIEEVTVKEGKHTLLTPAGETPAPNSALDVFIAPKPLAMLPPE